MGVSLTWTGRMSADQDRGLRGRVTDALQAGHTAALRAGHERQIALLDAITGVLERTPELDAMTLADLHAALRAMRPETAALQAELTALRSDLAAVHVEVRALARTVAALEQRLCAVERPWWRRRGPP